jgi:hypothetical protein
MSEETKKDTVKKENQLKIVPLTGKTYWCGVSEDNEIEKVVELPNGNLNFSFVVGGDVETTKEEFEKKKIII